MGISDAQIRQQETQTKAEWREKVTDVDCHVAWPELGQTHVDAADHVLELVVRDVVCKRLAVSMAVFVIFRAHS